MIDEQDFREFCEDKRTENRTLEEHNGNLMCIIESDRGSLVDEVVFDGDTITAKTKVEIDTSSARIYRDRIATEPDAVRPLGGGLVNITEDYEHLL